MTHWTKKALCYDAADTSYDPWFSEDEHEQAVARMACQSCPVRAQCLVYSLVNRFSDGIFAGLSAEEREPLYDTYSQLPEEMRDNMHELYYVPTLEDTAAYSSPSVEAKFHRRYQRAEYCYDKLRDMHPSEVPNERYNVYLDCVKAILHNPAAPGRELAQKLGRSDAWFNLRTRECFQFFDLDLSIL